jgi:hypothetical protein
VHLGDLVVAGQALVESREQSSRSSGGIGAM